MKKYIVIVILSLFISCDNLHHKVAQDGNEVDKTGIKGLNVLYLEKVVSLFKDFEDLNIPPQFQIDESDLSVNAGAAFGYLEVSRGLINLDKKAIQLFVLAHEVAHLATISHAQKFGLLGEIPAGASTNEYKKAEYLADLIAVHLISKMFPEEFDILQLEFSYLKELLGSSNFMHPSGKDRINSLNKYLQNANDQGVDCSFKNRFIEIWQME